MNKVILSLALLFALTCVAWADDSKDNSSPSSGLLLPPFQYNAYGLGRHSDSTGKPFKTVTKTRKKQVEPGVRVRPNAYGLGIGMDEFGRPVTNVLSW